MAATRQQQLAAQAARKLTPEERQAYGGALITGQKVRKVRPYFSSTRIQATTTTGGGQTTVTYTKGTAINAFGYGINDPLVDAGYLAAFGNATAAETNLQQRGTTQAGAKVYILGVSMFVSEMSEPEILARVWPNAWADVSLDGVNQYMMLGRLATIPQAGGMYGSMRSFLLEPAIAESTRFHPFGSSGNPQVSNYKKLPEPITWNPSGQADAAFRIRIKCERTVSYQTVAARTAASGIEAFTPPTTDGSEGTYVDMLWNLHTVEVAPRSQGVG